MHTLLANASYIIHCQKYIGTVSQTCFGKYHPLYFAFLKDFGGDVNIECFSVGGRVLSTSLKGILVIQGRESLHVGQSLMS